MLKAEHALKKVDYIFYMDADYWVCNPTDTDALLVNGLVATAHVLNLVVPATSPMGPVETNPQSTAYVRTGTNTQLYYCGGFQGGSSEAYLQACRGISKGIDEDDKNGIMAAWHDESHWNRYLVDHPPTTVLSQSYMYPESCLSKPDEYNGCLRRMQINPVMVALDKNHKKVRSI
jgi:histo-blood group ABO system transferase